MNQMKAGRKSKTPHTKKIKTHKPSGCYIHSALACRNFPDPLKMYRGKDYMEKFVENLEDEVKQLHATFPQHPMIELTDILKKEH